MDNIRMVMARNTAVSKMNTVKKLVTPNGCTSVIKQTLLMRSTFTPLKLIGAVMDAQVLSHRKMKMATTLGESRNMPRTRSRKRRVLHGAAMAPNHAEALMRS